MDVALLFLYIILGLSAFILPCFVHYAKKVLNVLDIIAIIAFILKFINIVSDVLYQKMSISYAIQNLQSIANEYLYDYVEGVIYSFVYLIFANISRYVQFGMISLHRIIMYFVMIILLSVILKLIISIP
jgi:cytochrome c biogenesis protein CcdA